MPYGTYKNQNDTKLLSQPLLAEGRRRKKRKQTRPGVGVVGSSASKLIIPPRKRKK